MTGMKWTLYSAHKGQVVFEKPAVMAIMNATPDSFSDGGELQTDNQLHNRIATIFKFGADIIDVGGESTRPGHIPVAANEEAQRVTRVIAAIREHNTTIPISIDTQKLSVAQSSLQAGADFVNDVRGLSDTSFASFVAEAGCSVVIMRHAALHTNVVEDCRAQLESLIHVAQQSGMSEEKIILDPGLGFGDLANNDFSALPGGDVVANLELVYGIRKYGQGLPVLIGASRKRFIGSLTGRQFTSDRREGSVAIAIAAIKSGASIIRAHDIRATVQARNIMISI